MADLCKQCSIELFNEDFGDLKGIVKDGELLRTICEGCGDTLVDSDGECVSPTCLLKHGLNKT